MATSLDPGAAPSGEAPIRTGGPVREWLLQGQPARGKRFPAAHARPAAKKPAKTARKAVKRPSGAAKKALKKVPARVAKRVTKKRAKA